MGKYTHTHTHIYIYIYIYIYNNFSGETTLFIWKQIKVNKSRPKSGKIPHCSLYCCKIHSRKTSKYIYI